MNSDKSKELWFPGFYDNEVQRKSNFTCRVCALLWNDKENIMKIKVRKDYNQRKYNNRKEQYQQALQEHKYFGITMRKRAE